VDSLWASGAVARSHGGPQTDSPALTAFGSKLDERGRRLFAAAEVKAAGRGGMAAVSGIARSTIQRGLLDLDAPALAGSRVRREGGGRREIANTDPTLINDLRTLAEPATMGDPCAR
jgi:hypothetical protein